MCRGLCGVMKVIPGRRCQFRRRQGEEKHTSSAPRAVARSEGETLLSAETRPFAV